MPRPSPYRNGLIFINLSKNQAKWNLKSRFQDYDSIISQIEFEKFEVGHRWQKNINCNWKIFWENYSEKFISRNLE